MTPGRILVITVDKSSAGRISTGDLAGVGVGVGLGVGVAVGIGVGLGVAVGVGVAIGIGVGVAVEVGVAVGGTGVGVAVGIGKGQPRGDLLQIGGGFNAKGVEFIGAKGANHYGNILRIFFAFLGGDHHLFQQAGIDGVRGGVVEGAVVLRGAVDHDAEIEHVDAVDKDLLRDRNGAADADRRDAGEQILEIAALSDANPYCIYLKRLIEESH